MAAVLTFILIWFFVKELDWSREYGNMSDNLHYYTFMLNT